MFFHYQKHRCKIMSEKDKTDKKKQPSWIKRTQKKQIITFQKKNTVYVRFLDEGEEKIKEITKKDGTKMEICTVDFACFDMEDKFIPQKEWNIGSSRLLKELSKFYPITGKEFEITAIGQRFDRTFVVKEITKI